MNNPTWKNTDNYAQYVQYLGLRNEWQEYYRDVNVIDALAVEIVNLYVTGQKPSWYHVGCELLKRLDTKKIKQAFAQAKTVCTFNASKRQDHRQLSHLIQSSIDDSVWVELKYTYRPWGVSCSFIKAFLQIKKYVHFSLVQRCYLAACIAAYKKNLDLLSSEFKNVNLQGHKLVPFSATAYYEALLTLFFQTKGVDTYTTFHGILGHYRQHITNDVVMGLNILSKCALAFSVEQKSDLIMHFGIAPEKIQIAGNPKYPYRDIRYGKAGKKCLILSGVSFYDNDMRQLLPIAEAIGEELGVDFFIKPHPSSLLSNEDISQYQHIQMIDKAQTIHQLLSSGEYKIAITHNTTAYYECMYYGVRPLRWGLNENLDFKTLDDKFISHDELRKSIMSDDEADYSRKAQQLLTEVLGMGINRYNEIINGK